MSMSHTCICSLQEEMNVLSSLKHPNIIRLIEVHFINNVFFLIMVSVLRLVCMRAYV